MRGIKKGKIVIEGVEYIHIHSRKKDDENSWNKCEHFVKHKTDEFICWDDESLLSRRFYLNGKLHREDGPASIFKIFDDTFKERESWYKHGQQLTEDEILNEKRRLTLNKIL